VSLEPECRTKALSLASNINVFGLAFVATVAVVVVAVDLVLLKFLIYLSKFRRHIWLSPRLNRWIQDGVLHLQRRAYEAQEDVRWSSVEEVVPLTSNHVELPDLMVECIPRPRSCVGCQQKQHEPVSEVMTSVASDGATESDSTKEPHVGVEVAHTMQSDASDDTITVEERQ
jgi:hypothetical protein